MPADASTAAAGLKIDLETLPGHTIRRMQQIAVAIFLDEVKPFGLTPIQYGAMQEIANHPEIDQRSLAGSVGLDTSTVAGVIDRLEARGLVRRNTSAADRRLRLLMLSPAGEALLAEAVPAVMRAQDRILGPLPQSERGEFMRMLGALVTANNAFSRAPSE